MEDAYVWLHPARRSGEACVGGTRIPTRMLCEWWWAGRDPRFDWGMSREQVILAYWYEAIHGTKIWQRRWREWAVENTNQMWEGNFDKVPYPPTDQQS